MTAYFTKTSTDILNSVMQKLVKETPLTATSEGSILRSFAEGITSQIGILYSVLDFNFGLQSISTASGQALDRIGQLYNVPRKTLTGIATLSQATGVFYFYIDAPFGSNIVIPVGTRIMSNIDDFIGQQYSYVTTENVLLSIGHTRAYASIRPMFANSVFTAGQNTLTVVDPNYPQPSGTTVKCTNPKPIVAQIGYEDDNAYRQRIIGATQSAAGGTMDAVRLVALGVNGVRDVTISAATYGMGSFDVIIVPEDNRLTSQILAAVTNALLDVKPVGVAMNIRQPVLMPITLAASVIVSPQTTVDITVIIQKVQTSIINYINTLLVGSTFVYNQLIETIIDAIDVVTDVMITDLSVNGSEVLRQNYTPNIDEQLIPGEISVTIANS